MSERFSTHHGEFRTTRWSVVAGAQGRSPKDPREAFETFYRQYASALYGYVRRRGHSPHDAQDLTQEFFARLFEKDWLLPANPEKGRLRSFLLTALKRFLANEWDRSHAEKRGGEMPLLTLNGEEAEKIYHNALATSLPDDSLYDRNWALALMSAAVMRLRGEFEDSGRLADFEVLKPCLTADRGDIDYTAIATAIHLLPVSARSVVHRFRKRFRDIFREEVANTVTSPAEVEDEMRALISTLGQL